MQAEDVSAQCRFRFIISALPSEKCHHRVSEFPTQTQDVYAGRRFFIGCSENGRRKNMQPSKQLTNEGCNKQNLRLFSDIKRNQASSSEMLSCASMYSEVSQLRVIIASHSLERTILPRKKQK